MAEIYALIASGINSVSEWMNTIGQGTIGVSLLSLALTIATMAIVLKYLVLPAAFGSGQDRNAKGAKK